MARRILGTSVATIERHYGKYIQSDAAEQPSELAGTVTPNLNPEVLKQVAVGQTVEDTTKKIGGGSVTV